MRPTVGVCGDGVLADLRFVGLASSAVLLADELVLPYILLVHVYGVSVILRDLRLHASMDGASNALWLCGTGW